MVTSSTHPPPTSHPRLGESSLSLEVPAKRARGAEPPLSWLLQPSSLPPWQVSPPKDLLWPKTRSPAASGFSLGELRRGVAALGGGEGRELAPEPK